MTIKIAYTAQEAGDGSTRHIAEAVTEAGIRCRTSSLVTARDAESHGDIISAHAKRQCLHNLLDQCIHQGLL